MSFNTKPLTALRYDEMDGSQVAAGDGTDESTATGVGEPGVISSEETLEEADRELEILVMPDYRDVNPYQRHLEEALATIGVSTTTLGKGGKYFPVLQAVRSHGRKDVLHFHFFHQLMVASLVPGPFPPVTSVLLSARLVFELAVVRLLGTSLVWTAHDLVNHERRAMRTEVFFKHLIIRFLCDEVVIHCEAAADVLVDTYRLPESTREKMTVIPHGHFIDDYPADVSRAEAREHFGYGDEETVFLFFGWIRRYKNVPLLLEAFSDLEDEDARLLVAGKPRSESLATEVERLAATDDRVTTTLEFVPDQDVQRYMAAADAVVLPFRTTDQSLLTSGSALLGMSFGKAVIAPDIGCLGGTLHPEGAVVLEEVTRESVSEAMTKALGADLAAMGTANRQRAEALDWQTIAGRTHRTYLAAMGVDDASGGPTV